MKQLCHMVKDILAEENNIQPVPAPVIICGDLHGQYYDLLELFECSGEVPANRYIFMGDFVDRGYHSVETIQLLLVLKLRWPSHVVLLRGNHESRQITQVYGFYDEVMRKYGNASVWRACTDLFDYLTLAALVDGQVMCVHGGLSPELRLLDQIRQIQRVQEMPNEGPFGDLMWSDPDDLQGKAAWIPNPRGAGWLFGSRATDEFCYLNGLQLIARAHQLVREGYKFMFPHSNVVTVWSAPNYCYRCGNIAATMKLDTYMNRTFTLFSDVERSQTSKPPKEVVPYFL
eukprot:GDKJ01024142.1.p1 GENE.GDKJ01024142.1~~GDKJ01024142.1.p1  ORF type:complete len:318 (-),score=31.21 GDKJ01024142.1:122-982(-)